MQTPAAHALKQRRALPPGRERAGTDRILCHLPSDFPSTPDQCHQCESVVRFLPFRSRAIAAILAILPSPTPSLGVPPHPRSSQFGVDFSNLPSIGVGLVGFCFSILAITRFWQFWQSCPSPTPSLGIPPHPS